MKNQKVNDTREEIHFPKTKDVGTSENHKNSVDEISDDPEKGDAEMSSEYSTTQNGSLASRKRWLKMMRILMGPQPHIPEKDFFKALRFTQSEREPRPKNYKVIYSKLLKNNTPLEYIGNKRLRRVLHFLKNKQSNHIKHRKDIRPGEELQDFVPSEKATDEEEEDEEEEESLTSKMIPKTSTSDEKWWTGIVEGKLLSRKRSSYNPKVSKDEGIGKRKGPRRRRKHDGHSQKSKVNGNGKHQAKLKLVKKGKPVKKL